MYYKGYYSNKGSNYEESVQFCNSSLTSLSKVSMNLGATKYAYSFKPHLSLYLPFSVQYRLFIDMDFLTNKLYAKGWIYANISECVCTYKMFNVVWPWYVVLDWKLVRLKHKGRILRTWDILAISELFVCYRCIKPRTYRPWFKGPCLHIHISSCILVSLCVKFVQQ